MRSFVAVEITKPAVLDGIRRLQTELAPPEHGGVKLQDTEKLHITLQFLGDVPDDAQQSVVDALSAIKFDPFDLQVGGEVGVFPDSGEPRVVWIGMKTVGGGPGLHSLAQKVSDALSPLGYRRDFPFVPHITILRMTDGAGEKILRKLAGRAAEKPFGIQGVDEFKIKKSVEAAGGGGHAYADLAAVKGIA